LLIANPERFETELAAADASLRVILLDEVQRVPALLDAVQVIVDRNPKRFRFLLSGSRPRSSRPSQWVSAKPACSVRSSFRIRRPLAS